MKCGNCELLYDALLQTLHDEQHRLENRIKYIDSPSEMTREERLEYYRKKHADITRRIERFKQRREDAGI